jgi:chemotaxis protein MotA
VYGVGSANLFFLPMGNKLRARARRSARQREMTLEGVAGIVEGLNPTLIRLKLDSYNDEPVRKPERKNPNAKGQPARGAVKPAA